jgi:hypothetical protein
MSKRIKRGKLDRNNYIQFRGNSTIYSNDGSSWCKTVTVRRDNDDCPRRLIGYCYRTEGIEEIDRDNEFISDLQDYILNWLKDSHDCCFYIEDYGPGQRFNREPQFWLEKNYIIINQHGGMDI